LIAGFPVVETWKFIGLSLAWLGLIYGTPKEGWNKLVIVAVILLLVLILKGTFPRANIEEGHNYFATMNNNGEILEQELPEKIFKNWQVKFNKIYTQNVSPEQTHNWKTSGVPESLYARSTDSIFRKAKYSRQVDSIYFTSLGDFRGGFANEIKYSYWQGEMSRREMPFFVMYELSKESVGSVFLWKGQVFWEGEKDSFEEINHKDISKKEITESDVGKKVYAIFFPKIDKSIYFKFEKSSQLKVYYFVEISLILLGWFFVFFLTININRKSWLYPSCVFSGSYLIIVVLLSVQAGSMVENDYPPHGGGDDGLVNEGWGRGMALDIADGNFIEAMKGEEKVYYLFTPGTRYFRMIEKLIYGDTNLGYMFVLSLLPIVLFHIFKHLTSKSFAAVMIVIFLIMPVGNLSYLSYVANGAKLGYSEAVGCFLFFIGLLLALKTQKRWGGGIDSLPLVVLCGALLAGSIFIRPNFAFAVVWLGMAYSYVALLEKNYTSIVALSLGFAFALWMPFHNWFYGGEFYLITQPYWAIASVVGLVDYWYAFSDIVLGNFNTQIVLTVANYLNDRLLNLGLVVNQHLLPLAWFFLALKYLALIVAVWFVTRWLFRYRCKEDEVLFIIGIASLLEFIPMMIIDSMSRYRYGMLGWELSLILFYVLIYRFMQKYNYKFISPS